MQKKTPRSCKRVGPKREPNKDDYLGGGGEVFVDDLLGSQHLMEGFPELYRHYTEQDKVYGAVEQGHYVHHLTKLKYFKDYII